MMTSSLGPPTRLERPHPKQSFRLRKWICHTGAFPISSPRLWCLSSISCPAVITLPLFGGTFPSLWALQRLHSVLNEKLELPHSPQIQSFLEWVSGLTFVSLLSLERPLFLSSRPRLSPPRPLLSSRPRLSPVTPIATPCFCHHGFVSPRRLSSRPLRLSCERLSLTLRLSLLLWFELLFRVRPYFEDLIFYPSVLCGPRIVQISNYSIDLTDVGFT